MSIDHDCIFVLKVVKLALINIYILKVKNLLWLNEDVDFFTCSLAFNATTLCPSGKLVKYRLKECLFLDRGAVVAVSLRMLSTNQAVYPRSFSTSHLNVFPLKIPNWTSYCPSTLIWSSVFPPLAWTDATAARLISLGSTGFKICLE